MIDKKVREYLLPKKILLEKGVINASYLLQYHTDQSYFGGDEGCVLEPRGYILFDFGKEYAGGVKLVCNEMSTRKNARVGVTFGESAMEALSDLGYKDACNDHAIRSEELTIPWVGVVEYGNTGFRFVKIENKSDYPISFKQIFAIFVHSDLQKIGSFRCNDALINQIFETGAYTIFLNVQDYVYDGIKRDRTVWIGDMHPETKAILSLYGKNEQVEKSLEFVRNNTSDDCWMNSIPSYSMWWIKIVYDYYFYTGDKAFLKAQLSYIVRTVERILSYVEENGTISIDYRFIDWPSSSNPQAQEAGIRALVYVSLSAAEELMREFAADEYAELIFACRKTKEHLTLLQSNPNGNKQAAALLCFAGLESDSVINESLLSVDPLKGVSTFLGYYVLIARAKAGDMQGALDLLRGYWGKMIELGATTFWEDFDIDWFHGAKPIDSILDKNEYDVHGDNGAYCYPGYRHSLCHGWSAGPVPFISEYVLGVRVKESGFRKVEIVPMLGNLQWAEGTIPTPYGKMFIRHERIDNQVKTIVDAPQEISWSIQCEN